MGAMTFSQLMKVSIVLPIMVVLSIICFMIAIERMIYFLRFARVNDGLMNKIRGALKNGNVAEAKKICGTRVGIYPAGDRGAVGRGGVAPQ
jgi:hypothetical protein